MSRLFVKTIAMILIMLLSMNPFCVTAANAAGTEAAQEATLITVDKPGSAQTAAAGSMGNECLTDKEKALQFGNSLLAYYLKNGNKNGPEWLKTTDIQFTLTEERKPVYFFETIQPLSGITGKNPFWFWQGRYAHSGDDTATANFGLGWRSLSKDKSRLWGLNAFYDYDFQYDLSRLGIGIECFNKLAEYRMNYYIPLSGDRLTGENDLGNGIVYNYIRAVRGLDYEIGTSLENARWVSFYATGFYYANKHSAAETGYRLRNIMQLTPRFSAELGYENSNLSKGAFYGKVSYQLADCSKPSLYGNSDKRDQENKDISYKLLQKVKRENDIKVETFNKFVAYSGNVSVTVTNAGAQPVEGVQVQAYQNGSPVGNPAITGVTGTGVITGLKVGTYTVKAVYFSYTSVSSEVSVQKGQNASTAIVLPVTGVGASAVVSVLSSQLQPVSGITVTARMAAIASYGVTAMTGGDGNAHFNNLPSGSYSFSTTVSGRTMSTVSVPLSAGNTSSAEIILTSGGPGTGSAAIKVTDGINPISGANVTCGSMQALTNSSGVAVLADIPAGNQTFTVSQTGYDNRIAAVAIESGITATATVTLTRQAGNASITVTDGAAPLSGATVSVTVNGISQTALTDGSGVAAFANLPTGIYTFTASLAGYTDNTTGNIDIINTGNAAGSITLTRQTGSVKITVTDGAVPLSGATVSVTVNGIPQTAITDSSGVAAFTNLPTGIYTFTASRAGYTDNTVSNIAIIYNGNAAGSLVLTRQTGNAKITVTDGAAALSGATVSVTVNGTLQTTTTDGSGVATFMNLPTGIYTFTASLASYTDNTAGNIDITSNGNATGSIALTRQTGNAHITVTDGANPLSGATVSVTVNGIQQTATTNGSGVAVFTLPTGTYTFTASMAGYTDNIAGSINVTHNGNASGSIALIRQTGNAGITVTDGAALLSGVTVSVTVNGTQQTATTNGLGVAVFTNLPTGMYSFTASMPEYIDNTVSNINIIHNGNATGSIVLARQTGNAHITVTDGANPLSGATVSVTVNGTQQTATTNGSGVAAFTLPTGTYTFTASLADYTDNTAGNVSITYNGSATGSIVLTRQTGNANITVTDGTNPLSGATVSVTVNGITQTATTDGFGIAVFAGLPTGTYAFKASMTGYTDKTLSNVGIPHNAYAIGSIALTRQTGNVHIFVNPGNPVDGATVSFTVNGMLRTAVSAQGQVHFANIPTGTYTFTLTKAGYTEGKLDVTVVNGTTVYESMYFNPQYGDASITVTDGVNPISGAEVSVTVHGVYLTATTNSSGVASFTHLQAGDTYTFTATMSSGYTTNSVNVTIPANATGSGSIVIVPAITVKLHFIMPSDNPDYHILGYLMSANNMGVRVGPKITNFDFDTANIVVPSTGSYWFYSKWSHNNGDGTTSIVDKFSLVTVTGSGTYNVVL